MKMKIYLQDAGHMTKVAAMSIYGKNPFKNILFRNRWTNFQEEEVGVCSIRRSSPS